MREDRGKRDRRRGGREREKRGEREEGGREREKERRRGRRDSIENGRKGMSVKN